MLKLILRPMSACMVFLYRLTSGKIGGNIQGLPVLLLTTTGRKSHKQRVIPLGYFEHEGAYVIIASNAGMATHPGWYHNLRTNPEVTVQIRERTMSARAETANPALRVRLWARLTAKAPGYKAYERRTTRQIPLVLLRPVAGA